MEQAGVCAVPQQLLYINPRSTTRDISSNLSLFFTVEKPQVGLVEKNPELAPQFLPPPQVSQSVSVCIWPSKHADRPS